MKMKMTMHNIKHASVSCLWWIPHTRTYVRIRKGTMSKYVFVFSPLDSQILFYDIHDTLSFHNQTNKNRGTHFTTLS